VCVSVCVCAYVCVHMKGPAGAQSAAIAVDKLDRYGVCVCICVIVCVCVCVCT
jgi:hypothetical protein